LGGGKVGRRGEPDGRRGTGGKLAGEGGNRKCAEAMDRGGMVRGGSQVWR